MSDLRASAFVCLTAVLAFGTAYSVVYSTYLDTSNPLLTHLPHPLASKSYFATKHNPLNTVFIKNAWGWTSAAFLALFATSPPNVRTARRLAQWATATAMWLIFTGWFFGPALFERFIAATGGECVLALPTGDIMNVPVELCFTKSTLSPSTHPTLFNRPLTQGVGVPAVPSGDWGAMPRLRRGHDVSGHVFLLTLSALFLADQLRASFPPGASRATSEAWPRFHMYAVGATGALLAIWMFASYITSVYFHTPVEKVTGYLLGVAAFVMTQLPVFGSIAGTVPTPAVDAKPHQS